MTTTPTKEIPGRVLLLPEELYQYLVKHVFEKHVRTGVMPDELSIAADLWTHLNKAAIIDYNKLGKAKPEITPGGVALNLEPEDSEEPHGSGMSA